MSTQGYLTICVPVNEAQCGANLKRTRVRSAFKCELILSVRGSESVTSEMKTKKAWEANGNSIPQRNPRKSAVINLK